MSPVLLVKELQARAAWCQPAALAEWIEVADCKEAVEALP
jgi:hypothetical protein